MVEIANYSDAAYIRQLWDVYLRQVRDSIPMHIRSGLYFKVEAAQMSVPSSHVWIFHFSSVIHIDDGIP